MLGTERPKTHQDYIIDEMHRIKKIKDDQLRLVLKKWKDKHSTIKELQGSMIDKLDGGSLLSSINELNLIKEIINDLEIILA